mmetsp:Transcript_11051/g.21942  ORF Transcript_11051/g.21942 Transcript_11051/m.21942 type:complete len:86 (+) Transcript_11051:256-513(+)
MCEGVRCEESASIDGWTHGSGVEWKAAARIGGIGGGVASPAVLFLLSSNNNNNTKPKTQTNKQKKEREPAVGCTMYYDEAKQRRR